MAFEAGGLFECGGCGGGGCKAYDTVRKRWRHLNFFQHEAFLHAPAPRVQCPSCGVRMARVPWARPRSGFTLLFEALVVTMAAQMPVRAVGRIIGEHDTRLWRIVRHHVDEARAAADHGGVKAVGVDEKACRRGHSYVTFFADLDARRLLYATPGRRSGVLKEFRKDLEAHGGSAEGVRELCMDMSAAYMKGARESFPDAEITFDRFHVVKLLNEAVEKVRRAEQKERPELKRSRWLWLWNPERLTPDQQERLDELPDPARLALDTAEACRLKLAFQEFWDLPPEIAALHLEVWCLHAEHSGLAPMARVAGTIRRHSPGILRWLRSRISNGMLEAMNSLVQAAKVRARGYRTVENFITMACPVCGKSWPSTCPLETARRPICPSSRLVPRRLTATPARTVPGRSDSRGSTSPSAARNRRPFSASVLEIGPKLLERAQACGRPRQFSILHRRVIFCPMYITYSGLPGSGQEK